MAWRPSGKDLAYLPQITVPELRRQLDDGAVDVLDVRQRRVGRRTHPRGDVRHRRGAR